jgi:hypothetical protein
VSRLWPDEVAAHLAPHRLSLLRTRHGVRRTCVREEEIVPAVSGSNGWEGALTSFEAKMLEPEWSGARVWVVLADQWVRYAPLAYVAGLGNDVERLSHARAVLTEIYGDAIAGWSLALSDAPPGAGRLACAMPPGLLEALREACRRGGARLVSVQPQLIAAYNHWRHALPSSGAWFVTLDPGSLAAARMRGDGFDRVHTVRLHEDWARELRRLRTFGRLSNESEADGRVFVDAPPSWREAGREQAREIDWLEFHLPARPDTLALLEQRRRGCS